MKTSHNNQQGDALARMQDVLREEFVTLEVIDYTLRESFAENTCLLMCGLVENPAGERFGIEATGVGMVDAFFRGLAARYVERFPSLRTIKFSSFSVRGLLSETGDGQATNAVAEVLAGVTNSYGVEFEFRGESRSVTKATLEAVLAAVEYFINSEAAYVQMYRALQHYRKEGRTDLESKYTDLLTGMVSNTSYSEVIERLKG